MNFFTVIPLLLFPVLVYNVIAWAGTEFATAEAVRAMMDVEFKRVTMASGADWVITRGAVMLTISLLLLFFEMLKSARTDHSAVMNHAPLERREFYRHYYDRSASFYGTWQSSWMTSGPCTYR